VNNSHHSIINVNIRTDLLVLTAHTLSPLTLTRIISFTYSISTTRYSSHFISPHVHTNSSHFSYTLISISATHTFSSLAHTSPQYYCCSSSSQLTSHTISTVTTHIISLFLSLHVHVHTTYISTHLISPDVHTISCNTSTNSSHPPVTQFSCLLPLIIIPSYSLTHC
jgi:hypothetical protein